MKKIISLILISACILTSCGQKKSNKTTSESKEEQNLKIKKRKLVPEKLILLTKKEKEKYYREFVKISNKKIGMNRISSPHKTEKSFIWYCLNSKNKYYKFIVSKDLKKINFIEINENDVPKT